MTAASVLIVEDSPTLRHLLLKQLQNLNMQTHFAVNGSDALQQFKKHRGYRLIIMDVMMPVLDGYAATAQIRDYETSSNLGHVPIVGVTCLEDRAACLASGMDDYYQKPLLAGKMDEIIGKWMPSPAH